MAYVADLITVLNSLFGKVTQASSSEAPKVTRQALTEVHQRHKTSDTRRKIYRRISIELHTAQNLLFMLEVLRSLLLPSLGFDPVPRPDSGNTRIASPSTGPGVASSSRPRPTEIATPSPAIKVLQPPTQSTGQPPQSTGKPPQSTGEPAPQPRSDSPRVWSRLIGRLTHPTEMATSSSVTRVAPPSPSSAGIPLLLPQSVGVLNITLKSRKAVRTSSPQSTSPPFWRYHP